MTAMDHGAAWLPPKSPTAAGKARRSASGGDGQASRGRRLARLLSPLRSLLHRRNRLRRVWAQDVIVRADMLQAKLEGILHDEALSPGGRKLSRAVVQRLTAARKAALKVSPCPGRMSNWWRGTLVDAAYQNLHVAEILMVAIYTDAQIEAEIPEAIARVEARLDRDDPRRVAALSLHDSRLSSSVRRERLAKAVQVGFEAADFEYTRLRGFRNAVLGSALVLGVAIVGLLLYSALHPDAVPICFSPSEGETVCASGSAARGRDLGIIATMGTLGGLLSAILSIKNMEGSPVAYDVPTALAALKLPVGALTALGGLLMIQAHFVPGLSDLDSQGQILAYAFVFGVAQQLVVGMIDKHAQELLAAAPGKATSAARPERITVAN
jgi:hypothetical protein